MTKLSIWRLCATSLLLKLIAVEACPPRCSCAGRVWDCSNEPHTSIPLDNETEILNLTSNDITVLRNDFFVGISVMLHTLYLNDNEIEWINPDVFSRLSELQVLNLRNNRIKMLHASVLDNNYKLKKLDVSCNFLKEIPSSLFESKRYLEFVNITGNLVEPSSITSAHFSDSLNLMHVDFCRQLNPHVISLQKLDYLQNYFQKLNKGPTEKGTICEKLDKVELFPTIVCFCNRTHSWFSYPGQEPGCIKSLNTSEVYSILNCNLKLNVTRTQVIKPTFVMDTLAWGSTNSIYYTTGIPVVPPKITEIPIHSSTDPTVKEMEDESNSNYIYAGIGIIVLVSLIVAIVVLVILKCRKGADQSSDTSSFEYQPEEMSPMTRPSGENTPQEGLHYAVANLPLN